MRRSFEQIQKIIIISALTLGLLISVGGVSYKYLLAKEPNAITTQNMTSTAVSGNLYSKLQLRQPINVVVFSDQQRVSKEQLDQLAQELATELGCKVFLASPVSWDNSGWSTLMTLNNFIASEPEVPDLILLYPSTGDQQEIKVKESQSIYEAILQTTGKAFPRAEILVQGHNLPGALQELVQHYSLPVLEDDSSLALIDLLKKRAASGFTGNNITNIKPLSEIEKYLSWQRIYKASLTHLMDKPNVNGSLPVLVGSQNGAFVESIFAGNTIGVLVKCVPDGGMARVYVDNEGYEIINTYAPEPVMKYFLVADALASGEHRVRLTSLGQGKYPSTGTRIIWHGFDTTGSKDAAKGKTGS
ncbi:hypothetical protein JCM14036_07980 [Desulfotomaculum defluvii]